MCNTTVTCYWESHNYDRQTECIPVGLLQVQNEGPIRLFKIALEQKKN